MPFDHSIWILGEKPGPLPASRLVDERQLEEAIESDPSILNDRWLIVGRQVPTGHGGFIDLLAVDEAGSVIVIELKRDRTPRDVVAQVLDYAAWVASSGHRLPEIYARYASQRSGLPETLDAAFSARFDTALPEPDELTHQAVVVASSLDASTERIVAYLADRDVPLNVVFFQVFEHEGQKILSRVWFRDPGETQESAHQPRTEEPWNGEYYVCFGHDQTRGWEDARRYGFVSAGGGSWYTRTLHKLKPADRVWVCVPKTGYVGVGIVEASAVPIQDFVVRDEQGREIPLSEAPMQVRGMFNLPEDRGELAVRVRWIHTVPLDQAVWESGFFANQNTVCAPTTPSWRFTVERLAKRFGISDVAGVQAGATTRRAATP